MIWISSSCIKKKYIYEVIEEYADAGIKNIELSGGTMFYPDIENDLFRLKKKHNLNYACHAYFPPAQEEIVVNLASCNDDIYIKSLRHYRKCIEMMTNLDIHFLSIHAGFYIEVLPHQIGKRITNYIRYDHETSYRRFIDAYEEIDDLCKKNEIELYLENNVLSKENYDVFNGHNEFMLVTSEDAIRMEKDLYYNLLLDLGHLNVSSNVLNREFIAESMLLKDKAKWLHVSNNNGWIDQHQPLVRESDIFKQLMRLKDYVDNITIEINGTIKDILESMELIEVINK